MRDIVFKNQQEAFLYGAGVTLAIVLPMAVMPDAVKIGFAAGLAVFALCTASYLYVASESSQQQPKPVIKPTNVKSIKSAMVEVDCFGFCSNHENLAIHLGRTITEEEKACFSAGYVYELDCKAGSSPWLSPLDQRMWGGLYVREDVTVEEADRRQKVLLNSRQQQSNSLRK